MKKFTAFFFTLILLAGGVFSFQAAAAPEKAAVRFHNESAGRYDSEISADIVGVTLNGEAIALDVPAVIYSVDGIDGRTMVPVRPIAEALGASVLWLDESRQVLIQTDQDTIVLTLGSAQAQVNGQTLPLPGAVPAAIAQYGGAERTMVPLRFVSEQLHASVDWDSDSFTAVIVTAGQDTPLQPDKGTLLGVVPDHKAQSIAIYLECAPKYELTDLGDRVVIDLPGFVVTGGREVTIPLDNPVVRQIRYAQHGSDLYPEYAHTTRMVLDLAEGCTYSEHVAVFWDENLTAFMVLTAPPGSGIELPLRWGEDWDPSAYTVVLDAGHGGSASGAMYEGIMEKNITLPITLRAGELLEEKGYNIVLTRSTDVYMDLYDRSKIANNVGADIFVSIHANASSTNREFEGTFTYSYPGSQEGERLAQMIQNAVVRSVGSIDRGLLTNNYVVLRETNMPAALLETGFMSCHEELMRLVEPEYQEKLAQGVARGIENYLASLPGKQAQELDAAS